MEHSSVLDQYAVFVIFKAFAIWNGKSVFICSSGLCISNNKKASTCEVFSVILPDFIFLNMGISFFFNSFSENTKTLN